MPKTPVMPPHAEPAMQRGEQLDLYAALRAFPGLHLALLTFSQPHALIRTRWLWTILYDRWNRCNLFHSSSQCSNRHTQGSVPSLATGQTASQAPWRHGCRRMLSLLCSLYGRCPASVARRRNAIRSCVSTTKGCCTTRSAETQIHPRLQWWTLPPQSQVTLGVQAECSGRFL